MSTLSEALAPRSDQLNGDDLMTGPRVLKFTDVKIGKDGRQTRISLNYEGDNGKPFKPCKTMGRAMVLAWAIEDGKESAFIGKSVRVYRDPDVKFGDDPVGGIRISHMSHISKPVSMKLTVSQGKKGMFTFHPLVTDVPQQQRQTRADTPDAKRADAVKWAEWYEDEVRNAPDQDALDALDLNATRGLANLQKNYPDLHKRVTDFRNGSGTGAHTPEGRREEDFGDQHDGEEG